MPSWVDVMNELNVKAGEIVNPLDSVRRKYLSAFNKYTNRNVIAYYSAFLQKPSVDSGINDNDMNAFMQVIYGLDKSKGLDIILHTPGGIIASAISIIEYLHSIFGNDIRAFVPQLSMSAGTMIALSCKEIIMGKESAIGPIDPQFGGVSCYGVVEEFERACEEVTKNPATYPLWQTIVGQYTPTFIGDCEKAIEWSYSFTKKALLENMFDGEKDSEEKAEKIAKNLSNHSETYYHGRQYHIDECKELGIKVVSLESMGGGRKDDCKDIQDCLLTIHHTYMHTFSKSNAVKIVENHNGVSMIISENIQQTQ